MIDGWGLDSQAPLHLRQVRTATSVRILVPMYLLMYLYPRT